MKNQIQEVSFSKQENKEPVEKDISSTVEMKIRVPVEFIDFFGSFFKREDHREAIVRCYANSLLQIGKGCKELNWIMAMYNALDEKAQLSSDDKNHIAKEVIKHARKIDEFESRFFDENKNHHRVERGFSRLLKEKLPDLVTKCDSTST